MEGASAEDKKRRMLLAVDVEMCDLDVLRGCLFAVGLGLVDASTLEVVSQVLIVIPPSAALDQTHVHAAGFLDARVDPLIAPFIDARVYESIWRKETDVLCGLTDRMKTHPGSWEDVACALRDIFARYDAVELVSDCPDFDFGLLNVRLVQRVPWVDRRGVRWMGPGGRRMNMRDPYEELTGFAEDVQAALMEAVSFWKHTHHPDADAVHLAMLQALILKQLGL